MRRTKFGDSLILPENYRGGLPCQKCPCEARLGAYALRPPVGGHGTESGIRDKNDEGWARQAHLRDRRTSGFPLPELGSVRVSGTRDLVVCFDSKANGTGTLRQFVSKATRPKLPGGLLL